MRIFIAISLFFSSGFCLSQDGTIKIKKSSQGALHFSMLENSLDQRKDSALINFSRSGFKIIERGTLWLAYLVQSGRDTNEFLANTSWSEVFLKKDSIELVILYDLPNNIRSITLFSTTNPSIGKDLFNESKKAGYRSFKPKEGRKKHNWCAEKKQTNNSRTKTTWLNTAHPIWMFSVDIGYTN